ncbi:Spo0E family sporulation regulatory protein-aspartic acid phosphatase [Bacillus pinisoli]|uniref:Spo0E family sporulation regulatory protein-aspartic acid phosphatase n=1 Tax=Bacillus pinisoli TaxID=2901866 RepID=UPI001FF606A8|nr:aspartyl-phosphate phosphatase Spo0E family protein [Bacillus pinisoli]
MGKQELLQQIEHKRHELFQVVAKYGLSSDKTIESSKQLDDLLNTYNRLHLKTISQ